MSYITDVVVLCDYIAPADEAALTSPMPFDGERHQRLARIDMDGAGGVKVFTSDVFAAACNYLDAEAFEDWIRGLPWQWTATVWLSTEGDVVRTFSVGPIHELGS